MRRFWLNVLRAFALKMRKLPRLFDVGCFPNCRSAFLRFLMTSLQPSLNHCLPGCFGFAEVFGIVLSAIDITISLNIKMDQLYFPLFEFEVLLCTSVRTVASKLCQIYIAVVFPHTVEFKLSGIL